MRAGSDRQGEGRLRVTRQPAREKKLPTTDALIDVEEIGEIETARPSHRSQCKDTGSRTKGIGRGCPVFGRNLRAVLLHGMQSGESRCRIAIGREVLRTQLLRCNTEHALEVSGQMALIRKSNGGGVFPLGAGPPPPGPVRNCTNNADLDHVLIEGDTERPSLTTGLAVKTVIGCRPGT